MGVSELVKMLTNQDTLKKLESIIMTNNEHVIDLNNNDSKMTILTSTFKSLVIKENENIRSRRKQKLHQQIKQEEEKYFNDSENVLVLSTKIINETSHSTVTTSTIVTSSIN